MLNETIARRSKLLSSYGAKLNSNKCHAPRTYMTRIQTNTQVVLQEWKPKSIDEAAPALTAYGGKKTDQKSYEIYHIRRLAAQADSSDHSKQEHEFDAILRLQISFHQSGQLFAPLNVESFPVNVRFYETLEGTKNSVLEGSSDFVIPRLPPGHPLKGVRFKLTVYLQSHVRKPNGAYCYGPDVTIRSMEVAYAECVENLSSSAFESLVSQMSITNNYPNKELLAMQFSDALAEIDINPNRLYVSGCVCAGRTTCPFCVGSVPLYERVDPMLQVDDENPDPTPLYEPFHCDQPANPQDYPVPDPPPHGLSLGDIEERYDVIISVLGDPTLLSVFAQHCHLSTAFLEVTKQYGLSHGKIMSSDASVFMPHHARLLSQMTTGVWQAESELEAGSLQASFSREKEALDAFVSEDITMLLSSGVRYLDGGLKQVQVLLRTIDECRGRIMAVDTRCIPENHEKLRHIRQGFAHFYDGLEEQYTDLLNKTREITDSPLRRIAQMPSGHQCTVFVAEEETVLDGWALIDMIKKQASTLTNELARRHDQPNNIALIAFILSDVRAIFNEIKKRHLQNTEFRELTVFDAEALWQLKWLSQASELRIEDFLAITSNEVVPHVTHDPMALRKDAGSDSLKVAAKNIQELLGDLPSQSSNLWAEAQAMFPSFSSEVSEFLELLFARHKDSDLAGTPITFVPVPLEERDMDEASIRARIALHDTTLANNAILVFPASRFVTALHFLPNDQLYSLLQDHTVDKEEEGDEDINDGNTDNDSDDSSHSSAASPDAVNVVEPVQAAPPPIEWPGNNDYSDIITEQDHAQGRLNGSIIFSDTVISRHNRALHDVLSPRLWSFIRSIEATIDEYDHSREVMFLQLIWTWNVEPENYSRTLRSLQFPNLEAAQRTILVDINRSNHSPVFICRGKFVEAMLTISAALYASGMGVDMSMFRIFREEDLFRELLSL